MLKNLKQLRLEKGLTRKKVAEDLGVSLGTYRNWEQGVNAPRMASDLAQLASYFDVTIDQLLGRSEVYEPLPKLKVMTKTAPLYGAIAAGAPMEMWEYLRHVPLPDAFAENGKEYFYLEVQGESMNKVILNGSYALIEHTQEVNNGDIAAVIVNGHDATLKKWYKTENSLVLSPSSYSEEFDDIVYRDGDESNPEIKVLGRCVWWMGPLD